MGKVVGFYKIEDNLGEVIGTIFESYSSLLPESKGASIFLKPNCNSDMIGLTGNTTDLRIIVGVVTHLQQLGYSNLIIGDGPSSGFVNAGIDVLERLRIRELGRKLGVRVVDLNFAPYQEVDFGSIRVKLARVCFEADLFINLPKIKTHGEAGLSCCMKNLIGCVVGVSEKQKIHQDLGNNIIKLNKYLIPHLQIVDGLYAMEGNGPSDGRPRKLNVIFAGTGAQFLDKVIAAKVGFSPAEIVYLRGVVSREVEQTAAAIAWNVKLVKPSPPLLQRIVNYPQYRQFFAKLRYFPVLRRILSSPMLSGFLKVIGLRQDLFDRREAHLRRVVKGNTRASARAICPMGIDPFKREDSDRCISCLYCYFISCEGGIGVRGDSGYLRYQIKKYRPLILQLRDSS